MFIDALATNQSFYRAATALSAELLFAGTDYLRQSGNVAAAAPLFWKAADLFRTAAPDDFLRGRDPAEARVGREAVAAKARK
jgi:hypothetical protein